MARYLRNEAGNFAKRSPVRFVARPEPTQFTQVAHHPTGCVFRISGTKTMQGTVKVKSVIGLCHSLIFLVSSLSVNTRPRGE